MMSISEESVVAGIMTFLLYGALPLAILLYLSGAPAQANARGRGTAEQGCDGVSRCQRPTGLSSRNHRR
jgi:hypothetical protein